MNPLKIIETPSGWAVQDCETKATAEFLSRREAEEALSLISSGEKEPQDYDWLDFDYVPCSQD